MTEVLRQYRVIAINWILADNEKELPNEAAVYQLYGDSDIYGRNVLLYIGLSRNLKARITEHRVGNTPAYHMPNMHIRYALCDQQGPIEDIESILIAHTKPSRNKEYLFTVTALDSFILLQNHGDKGVVPLEMTNSYWVSEGNTQKFQQPGNITPVDTLG